MASNHISTAHAFPQLAFLGINFFSSQRPPLARLQEICFSYLVSRRVIRIPLRVPNRNYDDGLAIVLQQFFTCHCFMIEATGVFYRRGHHFSIRM